MAKASTSPEHTTVNSPQILRTYANMILYIRVTQETMDITDPSDTIIPTDIIKAISETAQNRLVVSKYT